MCILGSGKAATTDRTLTHQSFLESEALPLTLLNAKPA